MEEVLRVIYEKVETLYKLKKELGDELEKMVTPIRSDEKFHSIAGEIIPEDLRKGPMGYEFLKTLLGEKGANKFHIHDPELEKMKAGEGI